MIQFFACCGSILFRLSKVRQRRSMALNSGVMRRRRRTIYLMEPNDVDSFTRRALFRDRFIIYEKCLFRTLCEVSGGDVA